MPFPDLFPHTHLAGSSDGPDDVGSDGDLKKLVVGIVGGKYHVPMAADLLLLLLADTQANQAMTVPRHAPHQPAGTDAEIQHFRPGL